jgi:serine-type D-Ala-D-Ala carboxypeptidase/endopeptidase (penicillin-binding protein 4)
MLHPRSSHLLLIALVGGAGCAHSGGPASGVGLQASVKAAKPTAGPAARSPKPEVKSEAKPVSPPASRPATLTPAETADRLGELRRLVEAELRAPELARSRVSLLVVPLPRGAKVRRGEARSAEGPASRSAASRPAATQPVAPGQPLIEVAADAHRSPASNAKLLTTAAAAVLLPGRYRFVTEVSRSGGRLYLWGTGDPVMRTTDLVRLAKAVQAKGVSQVRGIVVDDSHFGRERLAPGFDSFGEGAFYRPTSGAINVDGNAIEIRVSAPPDRPKRPRVDITPPSDYVTVRKLIRYGKASKGPEASKAKVDIKMAAGASRLSLTIGGTFGRKAGPFFTRRAVPDPSLNAGWALYRALTQAGVKVAGQVRRGRRPQGATLLARREHSLAEVLSAANTHSDNLAAETLVRALSFLEGGAEPPSKGLKAAGPGSWSRGLSQLRQALRGLGLSAFELGNGSGLHRRAWTTARTLVQLLLTVEGNAALRKMLLPTMAVAGKSGTLAPRLRGSPAEGHVLAKSGTLAGVLALSGFVDPQGKQPLAFSFLVNGRSDRAVRARIDRITELLARYARGLPLEPPGSQPSSDEVE